MTTRYFEYAVSQGEGTLTRHRVVGIPKGEDMLVKLGDDVSPSDVWVTGEITIQRYAEFITIHGSEVAI